MAVRVSTTTETSIAAIRRHRLEETAAAKIYGVSVQI